MACSMRSRIGRYLIMVANSAMSCRTAREPRAWQKEPAIRFGFWIGCAVSRLPPRQSAAKAGMTSPV